MLHPAEQEGTGRRTVQIALDLGKTAVIWRGGCIIRAAFLDRIRAA